MSFLLRLLSGIIGPAIADMIRAVADTYQRYVDRKDQQRLGAAENTIESLEEGEKRAKEADRVRANSNLISTDDFKWLQ